MTTLSPTFSMAQGSDTDSFARLVAEHQRAVCAVAFSALGDRGASEEIAQEAFLVAWRKLPGLREPPKLPAWICGIARNLAKSSRRRGAKTEVSDELDAQPAPTRGPLDALLEAESHALVEEALSSLDETYREPLVLFYRQDMSLREVASALDISEANAKQRVSRGRAMLADNVRAIVERSLRKSGPGAAFTAAVVAATAGIPREAKAATAGGVSAIAALALISIVGVAAGAMLLRDDPARSTALGVALPSAQASVAPAAPRGSGARAKLRPSKEPRRLVNRVRSPLPSQALAATLEKKVDLVLNKADTGEVLRLLSDLAETPIVVRGTLASEVSVDLHAKTLDEALDQTLDAADAVWEEVELVSVVGTPGPKGPLLEGPPLTITLSEAPFADVLSTLGEALNMPVAIAPELAPPPLTLEVRDRSAGLVLADVVGGARLRYEIVPAIEVRADDERE